jgi:hypothetical protein
MMPLSLRHFDAAAAVSFFSLLIAADVSIRFRRRFSAIIPPTLTPFHDIAMPCFISMPVCHHFSLFFRFSPLIYAAAFMLLSSYFTYCHHAIADAALMPYATPPLTPFSLMPLMLFSCRLRRLLPLSFH